ncbi:MAG: hypothetical protein V1915_01045 [Candidatus Bathyarchaeota archaeon]
MSTNEGKVEVSIKYQGLEIKFSGTINEVTRLFLDYMYKNLPGYELISNLTLTVDFGILLKSLEGIVAITPEGLILTIPREKIGEREVILLNLIKKSVAYQLSKSEKDSVSIADLLQATGGKPSSTAARLSELVDMGWVDRVGRGEYKITTYGLKSFLENVLPKIKSNI